ncbi:cold-shock protein [Streptomyces mirabilis]|jgi:CspA family cold shock protein|uniref:Cold shock protein (Beta-ribbon, CspA family) n=1 Tax=Streptomyces mirabilis TaxID=68239 RepID=A0A1I2VT70_9ACTN|nr:cold shock domain-containing protein [Streptomyces mirabilis]SFG92454.1 cold shock protein (beta-ribbon, CspA family) [Streptomyces mirabilis]
MTPATVREWDDEEGWGVLDSDETPGGCWAHFSVIEMPGFRFLTPGRKVIMEWEEGEQDGYQYRATRIVAVD